MYYVLLYVNKLATYGVVSACRENSTRLKDRILGQFPDMLAVCEGRGHETLLMFDQNLAQTLHKACKVDEYDDGLHLMRAAQIVRRDMFNGDLFDGNFTTSSETNSVGKSLLILLQLILEGPCIDDANEHCSRAALSISQLITFNSVKKSRANGHASGDKAASVRHNSCLLYTSPSPRD